jgi:diaminohydroxyphosphoribosylaminopyrimidine deaminase/5-amino-6-(5-phosphoribosylamino)uracil reductase
MTDPNPKVAGKGLERLRAAGIEVTEGVLACEAARMNEVFIKWISTKMPFGIVKTAMTLDGKIATHLGHSQWITGPAARERVHRLRDTSDAIMVGIGTVLADDPALTTRLPEGGRNPQRIIVDSHARTPLTAKVVNDGQAPTIIAVADDAPQKNIAALEERGMTVLRLPREGTGVNLRELFSILGAKNITSVLIEGGATINAAVFASNLVDKIYAFVAPKIIGGKEALGPVGGKGAGVLDEAIELEELAVETIGNDLLISAYVQRREGRDVYRTCGRSGEN